MDSCDHRVSLHGGSKERNGGIQRIKSWHVGGGWVEAVVEVQLQKHKSIGIVLNGKRGTRPFVVSGGEEEAMRKEESLSFSEGKEESLFLSFSLGLSFSWRQPRMQLHRECADKEKSSEQLSCSQGCSSGRGRSLSIDPGGGELEHT